jgi:hypothetical protein
MTTEAFDVEKLISSWTQEERAKMYVALASFTVGNFKLAGTENTWCLPLKSTEPIAAKCMTTVVARNYKSMKPTKLLILEPTYESIDTVVLHKLAKTEKNWFRTRIVEPATSETYTTKRLVEIPRSTWRVRGMFIGADSMLPTERDISGDLFGPNGTLTFKNELHGGLDVSLAIENVTSEPLPFHAVLLGNAITHEKSTSSRAELEEKSCE